MFSRRTIWFTREGLYFLAVLGFILVGAMLREINLLYMLSGMMLAPLVMSVSVALTNIGRLRVQRQLPAEICAGETLCVELVLTNNRRRMPAWAVVVTDQIVRLHGPAVEAPTTAETLFSFVPAGQQRAGAYRVKIFERGRYRLGPMQVSSCFPLSLLRAKRKDPVFDTLLVLPRLGTLTRRWHEQVETVRLGAQQAHRQRGIHEGDYYALRDWRSGDSCRWIHWRTTARLGRVMVRQFEQQRNRDLVLLIDLWQPETPAEADLDRVETAVSLAATVVTDLCSRGGSRLTLVAAGERLETRQGLASPALERELLAWLALMAAGAKHASGELFEAVDANLRTGTQTVLVSTRSGEALGGAGAAICLSVTDPELSDYIVWE